MIERRMQVRTWQTAILALFLVLGLSTASQAGPLGVNIDPFPDISAGMITTTYNATTGAFASNGWALTLNTGTGAQNITTNFKVLATIDSATGAISNASLLIGSAASPLLTSLSLMGFAYSAVQAGAIEFLFGNASGSYVNSSIYSTTQPIDVMLSPGVAFLGSFKTSFTATAGTAEIRPDPPAATPEPSALLLVLVAGIAMGAATLYSRRRGHAVLSEF